MVAQPSSEVRRVLRLRGGGDLAGRIFPPSPSEPAGALEFRAREPAVLGERVRLEISFGPLADEVELDGTVARVDEHDRGRSLRVCIDGAQVARMAYVHDVARGLREASVRRHRRVPANHRVRWASDGSVHSTRLMDISPGGAFIRSESLPRVGDEVDVELTVAGDGALSLRSKVTWISRRAERSGFGVSFEFCTREEAARVSRLVRAVQRAT